MVGRLIDGVCGERGEGEGHREMAHGTSLDQQWKRIQGKLKEEVGDTAFRSWLQPLAVQGKRDGEVAIAVPTRFMRDWIETHYADRIRALWANEDPQVESIAIVVASKPASAGPPETDDNESARRPEPVVRKELAVAHRGDWETADSVRTAFRGPPAPPAPPSDGPGPGEERDDLTSPLDPRLTFENFVVGKPNELAHAAARRVAEAQSVTFNPLFLYSGVGLGKTHLMNAIAWAIRTRAPSRKVIYLSAEKFMYHFVRALRFKDTVAFKEQYRSVDVLMVDDLQFITGKDSTQEEFFHTFNALVDQNRQVVVSADKSPSDLDMEERLRSRLGWGLVADIHPTTYELRLGILYAKAEALGVRVPQRVIEFLAHKISANVRELEGALNRIVAHFELVGRPITLETTQELLRDLLRANERRVTIDEIQRRVAEHFNIRFADMASARRTRSVARPRQVAMYLAKTLTSRSLPEIGRKFGGRDHTTVLHAVKKVEELRATDQNFAEDVELLRRMLET